MKKLKIGVVGLSFGMEFVAIYKKHPDVESVVVADTNPRLIETAKEKFGLKDNECFEDIQPMLDDGEVDAIHIVTPPDTHAELSVKVLNAGKHCGCTIPMGMSLEELHAVIDARKKSGKNYYTRSRVQLFLAENSFMSRRRISAANWGESSI